MLGNFAIYYCARNPQRRRVLALRRIVVGIERDPKILPGIERLKDIDYLKMVHRLKLDSNAVAAIWEVQFRPSFHFSNKNTTIDGVRKIELLSKSEKGSFLLYIEGEFRLNLGRFFGNITEGSFYPAFELDPKYVRISFLGSQHSVKSFTTQLHRLNVSYMVLSAGKAKFTRENVLSGLTLVQKRMLTSAHSMGYFDVPRKITTESLADKLGIDKSTLSEHLRKVEKRIIDDLLS